MHIRSSANLKENYKQISELAHQKAEPIYITDNGEEDLVLMSVDAFEKRKAIIELKEKLLIAEDQRLSGEPSIPLHIAKNRIKEKIDEKLQSWAIAWGE